MSGVGMLAVTFGFARYGYGLFVPEFRAAYGFGDEAIGLLGSAAYAAYLAATVIVSWAAVHTGPRLPVVAGGCTAALGMAMIGFSRGPGLFVAGVLVAGASPGIAYAPFADAVTRLVPPVRRVQVLALIGSGTSFGVLLSGPVALVAGTAWRLAWLAAAVVAIINGLLLPGKASGSEQGRPVRLRPGWFITWRSAPLLAAAFALGTGSAVYWTFAVDLLVRTGGLPVSASRGFMVLVGVTGIVGGLVGHLLVRAGGVRTFRASILVLAGSVSLLPVAPSSWLVVCTSGVLFGASYIAASNLIGIWAVQVYADRPSAGFGAAFFTLAAGFMVGPTLAGIGSANFDRTLPFYVAGGVIAASVLSLPRGRSADGEFIT
jgi:predicted MFS family arabinose efflux permease